VTEKAQKNAEKFECKLCDFICSKKSDYVRHTLRPKHKNLTFGDILVTEKNAKANKCELCDKQYKSRNGLWSHNKKYHNKKTDAQKDNTISSIGQNTLVTSDLIIELIKNNTELKNIILGQNTTILEQNTTINNLVSSGTTNISNSQLNNNSNNNSNNKTFNLHFFLNETCKDAMNIKDL